MALAALHGAACTAAGPVDAQLEVRVGRAEHALRVSVPWWWAGPPPSGRDTCPRPVALAACVQLGLSGPHLVPPQEPATRPPLTVTAFGMHLHAATTVDGRDRNCNDADGWSPGVGCKRSHSWVCLASRRSATSPPAPEGDADAAAAEEHLLSAAHILPGMTAPLPVFYDPRQHTDANVSVSPSAGKASCAKGGRSR